MALNQFANGLAVVHDVKRAALVIEVSRVAWNAEVMVDRRCDIARRDWSFRNLSTITRSC
jgi:hypothetical protein